MKRNFKFQEWSYIVEILSFLIPTCILNVILIFCFIYIPIFSDLAITIIFFSQIPILFIFEPQKYMKRYLNQFRTPISVTINRNELEILKPNKTSNIQIMKIDECKLNGFNGVFELKIIHSNNIIEIIKTAIWDNEQFDDFIECLDATLKEHNPKFKE